MRSLAFGSFQLCLADRWTEGDLGPTGAGLGWLDRRGPHELVIGYKRILLGDSADPMALACMLAGASINAQLKQLNITRHLDPPQVAWRGHAAHARFAAPLGDGFMLVHEFVLRNGDYLECLELAFFRNTANDEHGELDAAGSEVATTVSCQRS